VTRIVSPAHGAWNKYGRRDVVGSGGPFKVRCIGGSRALRVGHGVALVRSPRADSSI
jgi:hypothetical protein